MTLPLKFRSGTWAMLKLRYVPFYSLSTSPGVPIFPHSLAFLNSYSMYVFVSQVIYYLFYLFLSAWLWYPIGAFCTLLFYSVLCFWYCVDVLRHSSFALLHQTVLCHQAALSLPVWVVFSFLLRPTMPSIFYVFPMFPVVFLKNGCVGFWAGSVG